MEIWTTQEIAYLEAHAQEGAEVVARMLGRSIASVKVQASRYGISLKRRWTCPRCGATTYKPLSSSTGWCASCTREHRMTVIAEEAHAMREEAMREERNSRERQRLYAMKYRAKEKLKSMKR